MSTAPQESTHERLPTISTTRPPLLELDGNRAQLERFGLDDRLPLAFRHVPDPSFDRGAVTRFEGDSKPIEVVEPEARRPDD
jgi:hypothetical protein